jgi:hypothetical protein
MTPDQLRELEVSPGGDKAVQALRGQIEKAWTDKNNGPAPGVSWKQASHQDGSDHIDPKSAWGQQEYIQKLADFGIDPSTAIMIAQHRAQ